MNTLIKSLIFVLMVTGSCETVSHVTSPAPIIYTSIGQRSMWVHPTLGMQTDYFFISGRHARPIIDVMEWATLRIDGLVSPLWHLQKLSTWQLLPEMRGLGYYQRLEQTRRRCLQIRLSRFPRTTRFFLNQYRTVWRGQRQNYRTRYHREGSQERQYRQPPKPPKRVIRWDLIPPSTGRIQVTIPTTGRNYRSSSMTNRASGRSRTTFSITGGSQKRVSVSVRR